MPWFKVDDGFAFHPKVLPIANSALGLWVKAGAWCAHQLTDGHVPAVMVATLGGKPKDAAELVAAGLWHSVDGGFQFHDWHTFQPTREKVLADREAAKVRMKSRRSSPDVRANTDGTSGEVRVPRPDPTRPTPDGVEDRAAGKPRQARRTRIADDWQPSEGAMRWAVENFPTLDVRRELDRFRDHHAAKGSAMVEWDKAWRNWMRNAEEYARPAAGAPRSTAEDRVNAAVAVARSFRQPPALEAS